MIAATGWWSGFVQTLLLGAFVLGMAAQFHTGLADNGDFTRSIKFFSPGPVGIRPNFPPRDSVLWHQRFYDHWLPDWTVARQHEKVVSSASLLWYPAVVVARVLGKSTLSLPSVSLLPRALLFVELWIVLRWALRQSAFPWLPWTLGGPLVLLFTTTDNAAYLNSFYQEAASQVMLLPVLISLLWLKARPTWPRLAWLLGSVALLTAAKSSTIYWPLLMMPFSLSAWTARCPDRWREHARGMVTTAVAAALLLSVAARGMTTYREANVNPYHSLFYGTLMFSRDPLAHLRHLGLQDGSNCVGVSAYVDPGKAFFESHVGQLTFRHALSPIAHEPLIAGRMAACGLSAMQDISLEYLGKYAAGDARASAPLPCRNIYLGSEERFWDPSEESSWVNLWSYVKFHAFPTGAALGLTLAGFAAFGAWRFRAPGAAGDLALCGLLLTLACLVDMAVALLGEGQHELIKHLYFSNLLFDLAAISQMSGFAMYLQECLRGTRTEPTPQITSAKTCLTRMNTV